MLKARRILGRTLLIAALLWCGLWLLGRMALSDRLKGGLGALDDSGVAVEIGGHSISGFPFGYEARLSEVALAGTGGGTALRLPELVGEVAITRPNAMVARFPPRFEASLPGGDGTERRLTVASRDLKLTAEGLATGARRAVLSAERVDLSGPSGLSLAIVGLSAEAQGRRSAPEGHAEADEVEIVVSLPAAAGGTVRLELRMEQVRLTGATDLVERGALQRMLGGHSRRPGGAELGLEGRQLTLELTAEGTGDESDGRLTLTAAPAKMALAVAGGDLDAQIDLEAARIGLDLPGPGIAGGIDTGPVSARYAMPLGPSEQFRPAAVALDIAKALPDNALWREIDPEDALPREPLDLELELIGTARLSKPFAETRRGETPPVIPGTLEIGAARLSGLGAAARAEGAVEFSAGQAPTGEIVVTLDNAVALLRRLREAELIDQRRLQALALTLANFTRAGKSAGELRSTVVLDRGGISVNGEALR